MTQLQEREIFRRSGRYVQCQILNWDKGEPPYYIICNDLSTGELFLAHQAMGTWAEADIYMIALEFNKLHDPKKEELPATAGASRLIWSIAE